MKDNTTPSTAEPVITENPSSVVTPSQNQTPIQGVPKVETSPNFSASISTALVNGLVIPNGMPTTYWFEYGTSNTLGTKTKAQAIGSSFASISTPAYITGLKSDTVYYFRLSANNSFGTMNGEIFSLKTNSDPEPKAAIPTPRTRAATAILRTTATLNGEVSPNGWATNYWFEYGTDTNFGNVDSIKSITNDSDLNSKLVVSINLSNLEPLTKYYFRVNAQNKFGTVNGATLNFITKGPADPSSPTATTIQASDIANSKATLNGRVNPNGVDTTYWFEYSEDSLFGIIIGGGTTVKTLAAGTSAVSVEANIAGLSKNTKYFFRVVAKNQYGTDYGSSLSFMTKP
ncbi:MAG: hypothetical protein WCT44_01670 [Candidatus Paceibacterota bacterium]